MKLETILDAMVFASWDMGAVADKRSRQYHAFRARILRMPVILERDMDRYYGKLLAEKDKRIAELEGYIDAHNRTILADDIDALKEI